MYAVFNTTTKEEEEDIRKLFKSLDKNGDGQLSKAELLDGYHTVFGFADESMIEEIMEKLDKNESGFIDYSGTQ